jgi:hypothetical protein
MIEVQDYRVAERSARSVIGSWWLAETHIVDHFARVGFPVRIESAHEVGQLLDTMQEKRFERFLAELGGLSPADADQYLWALTEAVKFQLAHLPKRQPIVPFSTMLSSLALYKKIVGFKPNVETVLEVGPGCGYLSFFLARHASLKSYDQVEACESFYVLQSMINSFLFGHEFRELAIVPAKDEAIVVRKDVEVPFLLSGDTLPLPRSIHFPWWKLNTLYADKQRYDVVTSNANLNEFTKNALQDYLTIFRDVLKNDGIFLVQCTGFPAHGTLETLFDTLYEFRFAPLFCGLADENVPSPRPSLSKSYVAYGCDKKSFVLNNLIMAKEGHPLFASSYDRKNYRHGYAADFQKIPSIYGSNANGKIYSKQELAPAVLTRLASSGIKANA